LLLVGWLVCFSMDRVKDAVEFMTSINAYLDTVRLEEQKQPDTSTSRLQRSESDLVHNEHVSTHSFSLLLFKHSLHV